MINAMTGVIERRTGRYWRSQKTVTDKLYDGDGSTIMYLHHIDVQSLTAISVDNNYTGTFTTITTSKVKLHGTYGKLTLATELNPEVGYFPLGENTVKVSYTYGLETSETGTASAVGTGTLTDAAKTWGVNQLASYVLQDSGGSSYKILSNTATILTLDTTLTPATGAYTILLPIPEEVKYLCRLMVSNLMQLEDAREAIINALMRDLTANRAAIV